MERSPEVLQLLDAKQIATMLGLHLRTVQHFLRTGRIRGMKVGKSWKAYPSDVQDYLAAQRQAALATAMEESTRD
jgi:excisionase family DNA binding protein